MKGWEVFKPRDLPLWEAARPYLDVRNNDEHTIVAYGVAQTLLDLTPEADESVVLPAIVLHDVGWKKIPEELLLLAIGRKPTRLDLVREHELHSVEIARESANARQRPKPAAPRTAPPAPPRRPGYRFVLPSDADRAKRPHREVITLRPH